MENVVGKIVIICELISGILSIVGAYNIERWGIGLLLITSVIFVVLCMYTIDKKDKTYSKNNSEFAEKSKQISLCEKNIYYSMQNAYKNKANYSSLNSIVLDNLTKYANLISELLKIFTKSKVTVTIRIFKEQKKTLNKSTIVTLVYSENCEHCREQFFKERNKEYSIKTIEDNTDFHVLVGEDRKTQVNYFCCPNLKKYNKGNIEQEAYKNSNPKWEEFYIGRIVVPIIENNNKLFFIPTDEGDDIIGFLCIDTKDEKAFTGIEKQTKLVMLLESYAAKLHIILNKYKFYLQKTAEREKGGTI